MEKDLKILKKILMDLNYSETYIEILINNIIKNFNDSGLESITPHFIYYNLINDEGRETARKISNYFEQMKESGEYLPIAYNKKYM